MTYDLPALHISVADGVAHVTIDNPPLNLSDGTLLPSLRRFVSQVRGDEAVRVIVFDSADPDIFVAHGDTRFITEPEVMAAAGAATMAANPDAEFPADMNLMQVVHEEVRSLPQITIGKLTGLARGGGNEFLMALDMRFAAIGKAGQAQPEVLMGIMAGGGGTQYLTSLVGRARSLEILLGAQLVDAELAERYGLVNRALPADEIDEYVGSLARRIGELRPEVVFAVKEAVNTVPSGVTRGGLATENALLGPLFTADAAELAHRLLDAGMQTRAGELRLEALISEI
ncbi:enoyl-CoA hydratase/isomerase family protein [Curtobacterium sp. VKM Ac-2861]|uniref:enoyl-CoA hydratase/isomerase family protein n=1 Tax=unclassified Curtobacterium TaxID=257496 RepID=UPI000F488EAF|nr:MULTISPECIES: enoyl-CoA hydratase/isomerase family protein [unclassified Curtobacterium]NQW92375.1 enoyl-CoA hydratase/isomerase family protein [Curtobacterium sp. VKM Ac-2861]ROQ17487.1 enoyl-CoA hydratase/carnithine racemase [Curtobacterium sp. PhB171]ROQ29268.1 enoyl-CoA hydratase/carnithine racemase [Curtobacterium sp. PhB170]ROS36480.1 enoyl-CoA hydratase/carnithine racemase [Curtobacterium sp. PhB78]ROS45588.1 enoyl-CoA hydratase/carnithine racemase [Curtobacterium sp. PhB131]